uniref:Glycoprotein Ov7 n=1 Tax=Ovine gammaherpesvirus 2 TaxID=10398 RepID=A0A6M2ZKW7_9GAMA|nr:glycoprotein Ov7 [Ovine gammaherpesvirus 2]
MRFPHKLLLLEILCVLAALNICITSFTLGCFALYRQLVHISIGNLSFPHRDGDEVVRLMYIPPLNDSVEFSYPPTVFPTEEEDLDYDSDELLYEDEYTDPTVEPWLDYYDYESEDSWYYDD